MASQESILNDGKYQHGILYPRTYKAIAQGLIRRERDDGLAAPIPVRWPSRGKNGVVISEVKSLDQCQQAIIPYAQYVPLIGRVTQTLSTLHG